MEEVNYSSRDSYEALGTAVIRSLAVVASKKKC